MSRAKFEAARELIQTRQYDAARAILKTIDDPKAKEWITKIDGLSRDKRPPKRRPWLPIVLLAFLLLIIVAGGLYLVNINNIAQQAADAEKARFAAETAEAAFASACRHVRHADYCNKYAKDSYHVYIHALEICMAQYDWGQDKSLFANCLALHDVIFP